MDSEFDDDNWDGRLGKYDVDILDNTLSFYIRSLNLELSRDLDRRLKGLEVARGTGKVTTLFMVRIYPGIRASEISYYAGKDAAAMARILNKLCTGGLIERREDKSERRAQNLFITEKGIEVADRVEKIIVRERKDLFPFLSDEEHAMAIKILRKGMYWMLKRKERNLRNSPESETNSR